MLWPRSLCSSLIGTFLALRDDSVWQHPAYGRLFWAPEDDENDKGIPSVRPHVQLVRSLIRASAADAVPARGSDPHSARGVASAAHCVFSFSCRWVQPACVGRPPMGETVL